MKSIAKDIISKNSYLLFFGSYLIPIFYSYFSTDYFVYVNAWDEPTYLSYQGALATLKLPGYFASSWFVLLFHQIGVSGAYQNLIFDIFVPAFIFFCLNQSLKLFGLNSAISRAYSIILVFGSVLFNTSNPFLWLIARQDFGFVVSAMEGYPSLLRTPNPQFSYLLVVGFFYLYLRFKRKFILVLPIPFLYWAVVIPYTFAVASFFFYCIFQPRKYHQLVIINLCIMFLMGASLSVLIKLVVSLVESLSSNRLFVTFNDFLVSPVLLWSICSYLIVFIVGRLNASKIPFSIHYLYVSSICCVFLITNLQLFTRVRLDPKGLQDSSGTFIASCLLVLTLHVLTSSFRSRRQLRGIILRRICLILVFVFLVSSQGFSFKTMQYKIFTDSRIREEALHELEQNALNAIIPWIDTASTMTLLAPKLIAPPFAYQYSFPEINRLCSLNKSLMSNAYDYLQERGADEIVSEDFIRDVEESYEYYLEQEEISDSVGYQDEGLVCSETTHLREDFYAVGFNKDPVWSFFPNWSNLRAVFLGRN